MKNPSNKDEAASSDKRETFSAGPDDEGKRLDAVAKRLLRGSSLGTVQKAIRRGDIRLGGTKASPETRVESGSLISVWKGLLSRQEEGEEVPPLASKAPPIPTTWIIFESDDLLVLNKPCGLLVHKGAEAAASRAPTLEARVRTYLSGRLPPSLSFRPGPLHRLDRETSGLIVFSKSLSGAHRFTEALRKGAIRKTYLTLLEGSLTQGFVRKDPLQRNEDLRTTSSSPEGKPSTSYFRPLRIEAERTWTEVEIESGRTHQIRAHAKLAGAPLAGDLKYGGKPLGIEYPVTWLLHAWRLEAPESAGLGWLALTAPPPEVFPRL